MLTPHKEDTIHKAWLLRLLTAVYDHPLLFDSLGFKGGTCAAMRGFLDRFSVDLDFDFLSEYSKMPKVRQALESIFKELNLTIKDQSTQTLRYFLQYPTKNPQARHTVKIETLHPSPKANRYEKVRLVEIDRIVTSQTRETMMANKLVALIERYERTGKIAGRDLFDIHHFFFQGYAYDPQLIFELRGTTLPDFFHQLIKFIEKEVTQTLIDQDLNVLLPLDVFHSIRKVLKQEVIRFLMDELERLEGLN